MPLAPELPRNLCLNGRWAISITDVVARGVGEQLEAQMEVVVSSLETPDGYLLKKVVLQPMGSALAPMDTGHVMFIQVKDADWATPYISESDGSQIDPDIIYGMLNKAAARKLLSGHLLAVRYNAIVRMREIEERIDIAARWDKEFKFLLGRGEESLTKFTAISYKALTEWLETSPAQLLASIEGVSVTTIRNRIYAAREIGAIEKPGAGKRSAKKNPK